MPSWQKIQDCIIKEQVIKIKEEVMELRKMKGKFAKIEKDPEVENLILQKLMQWKDIF